MSALDEAIERLRAALDHNGWQRKDAQNVATLARRVVTAYDATAGPDHTCDGYPFSDANLNCEACIADRATQPGPVAEAVAPALCCPSCGSTNVECNGKAGTAHDHLCRDCRHTLFGPAR